MLFQQSSNVYLLVASNTWWEKCLSCLENNFITGKRQANAGFVGLLPLPLPIFNFQVKKKTIVTSCLI